MLYFVQAHLIVAHALAGTNSDCGGLIGGWTQKHKILLFVVLNMAKYTIILLILIDLVPIFFIFNLFEEYLGGHSAS